MASSKSGSLESDVTYEDLLLLEWDFHKVDTEVLQRQWTLFKPLYAKRNNLASRIPHFWALVFEEAPPEIDHHIQPSDSELFAECLQNVEMERFELDKEPRSFLLRFHFGPNKWFEDKVLEKQFWHRQSQGNWQGLVSEPVKVNWKKGNDLSNGINDASLALWEVFKAKKESSVNGFTNVKGAAEYKALAKKLETIDLSANSFFTLFSFISTFRYVDEKESLQAYEAEAERREKRAKGEKVEEPDEEDGAADDEDVLVCPPGEDLALAIADDIYPNAIKYFTTAQDREDISDDDEEDSDEDVDMDSEDDGDVALNIRSLVGGKSRNKRPKETSMSSSPPPTSRARTSV